MALSERSQATKNAYRSIPFIEHSRKCEITYAGKVAQWFPGDVGGQKVPHGSPRDFSRMVAVFSVLMVVMVLWVYT